MSAHEIAQGVNGPAQHDSMQWLRVEQSDAGDRIVIHRGRARWNWSWSIVIVLAALVWIAGTVAVTVVVARQPDTWAIIGSSIGWFGVVPCLVTLSQLFGVELVDVSSDGIAVTRRPSPWRGVWRCPAEKLDRISLEYWTALHDDEAESVLTVNVVRSGWNVLTRRCILGVGLGLDARRAVYEAVVASADRHGLRTESAPAS